MYFGVLELVFNVTFLSLSSLDAGCHSERRQPAGVCPCPGCLPEEVSVLSVIHILFLACQIMTR